MPTRKQLVYFAAVLSCFVPLLKIAQIIDAELERRQLQQCRVYYVCSRCGSVWVGHDDLFDAR